MRVLQVTPRYFPNIGGVEIIVKKISESLVEKGLPVTVYSTDLSGYTTKEQNINGVLVKRFKPLVQDPLYLPPTSFFKAINREKIDIIHVHSAHTLLPTCAALSKTREQKLLLQPHYHKFGQTFIRNFLLGLHKYSLKTLVFPRTDCVIVNSPYELRALLGDFSHCRDIVLIPEGVSLEELQSVEWKPERPKRILYVGALRRYKNVGKLLKAFAYLAKTNRRQFKLVIVGDGPERRRLFDLAHELRIASQVEWKRNLSRHRLLEEYARTGVFVSLSLLESFSIVVHEAIFIGVPTVVPNFGPTADLAKEDLATGTDSLDPEAIAEAILEAEENPRPKNDKVLKMFLGWDKYLERILELYRRVLKD